MRNFLAYESDKEGAIELVRKRVPVNEGELAEAVAEVSGNEFVGPGMRPGDVRRLVKRRTKVPTADSCTEMKPMRIVTENKDHVPVNPHCATMRVKGLISRLKGDFANKPFRTPVETRFAL